MYNRKWKPSKKSIKEFVKKMDDIQEFCDKNSIFYSKNMDSYYFNIDDKKYRVSNHTIEVINGN